MSEGKVQSGFVNHGWPVQSERVWIVKAPLRRPVLGKPSPFGSPFGEGRSLVQPRTRFGKKHWRDKALRSYSGQQAEPRPPTLECCN